jgi:hypothetical protein
METAISNLPKGNGKREEGRRTKEATPMAAMLPPMSTMAAANPLGLIRQRKRTVALIRDVKTVAICDESSSATQRVPMLILQLSVGTVFWLMCWLRGNT